MSYIVFGALIANRKDSTSSDFQHVILVNLPPVFMTRTFSKISLEPLTQPYHQIQKAGPRCSHQHWSRNTCDVGRKRLFLMGVHDYVYSHQIIAWCFIWQRVECESKKSQLKLLSHFSKQFSYMRRKWGGAGEGEGLLKNSRWLYLLAKKGSFEAW